ncbi:MAG: GIY-YIG nuclease family protein [bacterium]|nr:GIY-YIG nuclease family protein [bacterium]
MSTFPTTLDNLLQVLEHFVYILECADNSLYVGCTNNLEKRVKEHNTSKQGAHYTKVRRPVVLKYSETFPDLKDARAREAALKHLTRAKKLALIA